MGAFEITGSDGITYLGRTQDIPELFETDPQFAAAYYERKDEKIEDSSETEKNIGSLAVFGDVSPAFPTHMDEQPYRNQADFIPGNNFRSPGGQ